MRQLPEKALCKSQLHHLNVGFSIKDNSHCVLKVKFIENGQEKTGFFKQCSPDFPALLAKMSVATSLFKRIFQGNRSAEERLVFDDYGVLIGLLSIKIDGFKPFNYAEEPIPTDVCEREKVIPSSEILIEKNIIELLLGRWFLSDDDCNPHHLSLAGDIHFSGFWNSFTIHMKNLRHFVGVPISHATLTVNDFENFPCIEDAKPTHWPTFNLPNVIPFIQGQILNILTRVFPKPYADPSQFANLAKSPKSHEQKFSACLKILLTYQPQMVKNHLIGLFGDMPLNYTSLNPQVCALYEREFPQFCNAETNTSPFVDFIISMYQKQYDNLYRVVVFYMGCDSNRYGVPLPATYHALYQNPSYYQSIKQWVIEQNKALYANDAETLKFNEDELDKRYHQIWRDAFAPNLNRLLHETYDLTNKLLKLASNTAELEEITGKSINDEKLTNVFEFFGDMPNLSIDKIKSLIVVDDSHKLGKGLVLLAEFYNKFWTMIRTYYEKERKDLKIEDNWNFCQQLSSLHEEYNVITRELVCMSSLANKFNAFASRLESFKSQVNLCNHLEVATDQFYSQQLLTIVKKLTLEQGITEFAFSSINLPLEIDGKRLNHFIELLEKQNSSIADLTCGLLLEGRIATTAEILDDCKEYDDYMEKRTHDAITFYTKAAQDLIIKPIVEFLLLDMRSTTSCPSIQERLAQYDLCPQGTTFINSKNRPGVVLPLVKGLGLFKIDENVMSNTGNIQENLNI